MKNKIIYMDGYDEVRDFETQCDVIFSTKIPNQLKDDLVHFEVYRDIIVPEVIDNVVNIWNKNPTINANLGSRGALDKYLLNEGKCTQEEREIITESLYSYHINKK